MIKKNGEKIAAIAIAGALMMQSMSPIFALEGQVEDNLVSVEEVINMESSEEVAEEVESEEVVTEEITEETLEVLSSVSTENTEVSNETTDLQLLTFNDLHGQIDETKYGGGIANLSGALKDLQKEAKDNDKNVLTMSAGDQVGGSPAISALLQDQPTLEMMEEMNVDIVTTGNHEYDEGIKELERLIVGGTHSSGLAWNGTSYEWITANVVAKRDITFAGRNVKANEPIMEPYTIREIDGVNVGIIGIVTKDTAGKVVPDGIADVEFTDEAEAINKYTEELKAKGIKTIIVLSHVPTKSTNPGDGGVGDLLDVDGDSDLYEISQKVDGEVDVIIGADNHAYANSVVKREGKDDIIITQAFSKGSNIGKIDLSIDKTTGDVVSSSAEILTVKSGLVSEDPVVAKMVEKLREDVKDKLERVIGFSQEDILKSEVSTNAESEMGRFVADSQLWAAQTKDKDVKISFMNIGGVRADISKGNVTYENAYSVQPFGNDLTKLTLTGAQIRKVLEQQNINDWFVARQNGEAGSLAYALQVGGFTYEWHAEQVDGKWMLKVDKMYLNDENKTEIKDTDEIKCVANIFLAQGGDGFTTFTETSFEVIMNDLDAFEQYITELSKTDNNGDGIVGLNKVDVVNNPNMINLDQDFDGVVDVVDEETPEEGEDQNPGVDEETPEEDEDQDPGVDEEIPEEDKDQNSDVEEESGNINDKTDSPKTGEASVVGYSVLGVVAAAGLSLINRRKIK